MDKMMRLVCIQIALLVACLAPAESANADYKRDYISSLRDFENEKYNDAIKLLESAIKQQPDASEDVRFYGMTFMPYLPHYYLGKSYFENEDCKNALSHWDISLKMGVVRSHKKEWDDLKVNQGVCLNKTDAPPAALYRVVQAYFDGKFREAAGVNPTEMAGEAKVQGLLFRAASNFNLYLLSGETEDALLQQSKNDIREIKRLKEGFRPIDKAFSPQFQVLFN